MGDDSAYGDFDAAVFAAAFDPVVKFEGKRDIERFVVHVKLRTLLLLLSLQRLP